jgi:hypothetical protein
VKDRLYRLTLSKHPPGDGNDLWSERGMRLGALLLE